MYEIEKDIPIPMKYHRNKFPFRDMEVGDSFFVPFDKSKYKDISRLVAKVCSHAKYYKKNGKLFTVRRIEGGVRCWRFK